MFGAPECIVLAFSCWFAARMNIGITYVVYFENFLKGQSHENVCEIIALNDRLDSN
jgi:hypothetical protein